MSADRAWLADASKILHVATQGGATQELMVLIEAFATAHGHDMIPSLVVGCIDTMGIQARMTPGALAVPLVMDPKTGKLLAIDATPSHVRTAIRLVAARLSMDEASFNDLIRSVPTGEEWGQVVCAAIGMCGDILRGRGELRRAGA